MMYIFVIEQVDVLLSKTGHVFIACIPYRYEFLKDVNFTKLSMKLYL